MKTNIAKSAKTIQIFFFITFSPFTRLFRSHHRTICSPARWRQPDPFFAQDETQKTAPLSLRRKLSQVKLGLGSDLIGHGRCKRFHQSRRIYHTAPTGNRFPHDETDSVGTIFPRHRRICWFVDFCCLSLLCFGCLEGEPAIGV